MGSSVSTLSIPQDVVSKFNKFNQLRWEKFTPEFISFASREIDRLYEKGVGIQAADVCRIFYVYNQSRKKYEGICYHLFDLVATKDGKGHIYFVKKSDIGNTEFPVIPSKWHNLDKLVRDNNEYASSNSVNNSISSVRSSLENQWNGSSSVSNVSSEELVNAISSISTLSSELSKLVSNLSTMLSFKS